MGPALAPGPGLTQLLVDTRLETPWALELPTSGRTPAPGPLGKGSQTCQDPPHPPVGWSQHWDPLDTSLIHQWSDISLGYPEPFS